MAVLGNSPTALAAGDPSAGQTVFASNCAVCHSTEPGVNKVGPSLAGIVCSESGTVPGFDFSTAMKDANVTWDDADLESASTWPVSRADGSTLYGSEDSSGWDPGDCGDGRGWFPSNKRRRTMNITHLLNGVAIAAALAIVTPVWAQTAGGDTYGGNSMGLPGPNPGGPDVPSPYDAPGGAYYQVPPRPLPASTSATPAHHAVRHASTRYAHHKAMVQKAALTGDTTAELNREELARLQSGDPPAPPSYAPMSAAVTPYQYPYQPNPSGGNSMGMPGPNPGGPGLTPYTD